MAEFITPEKLEQTARAFGVGHPDHWVMRAAATIRDLTARLQKADAAGIEMMRQRDDATSARYAAEERVEACAGGDALLRMVERYELGLSLHEDEARDANARADAAELRVCELQYERGCVACLADKQATLDAADARADAAEKTCKELEEMLSHVTLVQRNHAEFARLQEAEMRSREKLEHAEQALAALREETAALREAPPASEPQVTEINVDPGALGGDCTAETTWQDGAVVNVECNPAPVAASGTAPVELLPGATITVQCADTYACPHCGKRTPPA